VARGSGRAVAPAGPRATSYEQPRRCAVRGTGRTGKTYPGGASMLDPFSGRAMIPLEAARLNIRAEGIDYSPVAALAGQLLSDFPMRDWSAEPSVPFGEAHLQLGPRLLHDVEAVLREVGRRHEQAMRDVYPEVNGKQSWGYLWAATIPCEECGRRFPLVSSTILRLPQSRKNDQGQHFRLRGDTATGTVLVEVGDGQPTEAGTLVNVVRGGKSVQGKAAVCLFCGHVHAKPVHQRLAAQRQTQDVLLVAADLDDAVGKLFRLPTDEERAAADPRSRLHVVHGGHGSRSLSGRCPSHPGPCCPPRVVVNYWTTSMTTRSPSIRLNEVRRWTGATISRTSSPWLLRMPTRCRPTRRRRRRTTGRTGLPADGVRVGEALPGPRGAQATAVGAVGVHDVGLRRGARPSGRSRRRGGRRTPAASMLRVRS